MSAWRWLTEPVPARPTRRLYQIISILSLPATAVLVWMALR